jgi:hypothetical protein
LFTKTLNLCSSIRVRDQDTGPHEINKSNSFVYKFHSKYSQSVTFSKDSDFLCLKTMPCRLYGKWIKLA